MVLVEDGSYNALPHDTDYITTTPVTGIIGKWTSYRFYDNAVIGNIHIYINGVENTSVANLADLDNGDWHYGNVTKVIIDSGVTTLVELARKNT